MEEKVARGTMASDAVAAAGLDNLKIFEREDKKWRRLQLESAVHKKRVYVPKVPSDNGVQWHVEGGEGRGAYSLACCVCMSRSTQRTPFDQTVNCWTSMSCAS